MASAPAAGAPLLTTPLLTTSGLSRYFGGLRAVDGVRAAGTNLVVGVGFEEVVGHDVQEPSVA